jgi:hypothetical protein
MPKHLSVLRQFSGIWNFQARHDWDITGGYDPGLDGPDIRWPRIEITCARCGEKRRISVFVPTNHSAIVLGCVRRFPFGTSARRTDAPVA